MEPHWTTFGMFLATVIVSLVTATATAINYLLFRSQTDPEVIVYTKHDLKRETIITLVIENIGKSVAYDIRFRLSEQIPERAYGWKDIPKEEVKWMKSGPLIHGIPTLPPSGTRELDWGQPVGLESVIGNRAISVKAKFKAKKLFPPKQVDCETESKIDIESYTDTVAYNDNEPKKIREELSKINEAVKGLGVAHRPLHVEVVDNPKAKPGRIGNA